MKRETYLSDLAAELECRGVSEEHIGKIIAEVEDHLVESGESPTESFGSCAEYAEKMAVYCEKQSPDQANGQWQDRTFRATAFDEMGILRWAGEAGWELVDVGPYALFCRRMVNTSQVQRWEYVRRTGANRYAIKKEMLADNWETCGVWIVFHYFKRKLPPA